jgi:hypothetical protein
MNPKATLLTFFFSLLTFAAWGQSPQPYPKAISDQTIHRKTAMAPPAVNVPFTDPDFGSAMVRVTDGNSDPLTTGVSFQAVEAGKDEWSRDERKFFVNGGEGRVFAFGFDPQSMQIHSLGGMKPGQGLSVPLRPGPTFSRVDSDLIYGTPYNTPLTISSYSFSTNTVAPVIDTTTCGTIPALVQGAGVISDYDVNVSEGDIRFSISEGGREYGAHTFAIVYDKTRGCRWYNTETGEISGQWGVSGFASTADRYLIRHVALSRNGRYLRISRNVGFYVWDLETLRVTACPVPDGPHCAGYAVNGYSHMSGGAGYIDDWNIVKRPLDDLTRLTPLVFPLTRGLWGQVKHFTWNDDNAEDTAPLCGSAFTYYTGDEIKRPYDGEIFCLKTDGLTSTIWRFAHHRSDADPDVFITVPKVSVSRSGRFLLFNSNWDNQVGTLASGEPRADVWIVKLD